MKESISELKDKEGKVDIEVKIIYDQGTTSTFKDFKTKIEKKVKSVVVADVLSEKGDGGPTALLDLYDSDITKFKFQDIIKVTNAYTKKTPSGQFRITYANKIELVERPKQENNG